MRSTDNIEKLIKHLHDTTTPEMDKKILGDVFRLLDKSEKQKPVITRLDTWGRIMKNRIAKLAAAAVIIIVLLIGVIYFGGSFGGENVTFADVIQPFLTASTAKFKMTINSQIFEAVFMEPGRMRWANSRGEVFIADMQQGKMMILITPRKKAIVQEMPSPGKIAVQNHFNLFFGVRELIRKARETENESVELLGQKEINGITAIGYHVAKPNAVVTVWANEKSKLPVRIDYTMDVIGQSNTVIISDIVYNVELNESLFSLEPPGGYSVSIIPSENQQPRLVVTGMVKDAKTGQPVVGAKVSDDGYGPKPYKGSITDSEGRYRYVTWSEEHNIVVKAAGYKTKRKTLITSFFKPEKEKSLNFALERE